ncbi:cytoskeleton-associated protein 5-like [Sphaerodactylus townsendi]|uniref:cytoskeleton-associated protein 5-like n=1 Tax=Sphaerodactylus townsendi TaxID=933632 RepID=UPI00202673D7|nr:cytoskeleton-associated protein 5-like [Sphaerodactylus townsendi]
MLDPRNVLEKELSEESCELEAAAVLPASCLQNLGSSNWKDRISCLEAFEKTVEKMEKNQVPCQALVRLLDKEPGWEETKLQVVQKKLQIVTLIAQKGNFSKTTAQFVLENLVDKIGDVICGNNSKEALTAVAEACGLPWTAERVSEAAFSRDCPRTHSETLNWLTSSIQDFGFDGMEAKTFIHYMKCALVAVHPDVRTSAFNLLGVMYLYVGAPLRTFFEDEKPLLLSQIDAEFEKVKGKSLPPPTRGRCKFCRDTGNEQRGGDAQLCKRTYAVDLSKRISTMLMLKMQDPSWKIRREGLEELSRILSEVKSIQPNIGDLPSALKNCLQDSNKAIVKQTLVILQQLARAMGPGIKYHIKTLGIPLIAVFRDSKSNVRAVALKTVETWAEQTGMKEWLDEEDLSVDLKKENCPQKQGILGWLAEKLPSPNSASTELVRCLPHLYLSLEDCHEETRKAAHEAVPFFLLHLGFEKMTEVAGKLKPASREKVLLMLENTKSEWPTKSAIHLGNPLSKLPRSKPWPNSASPQQCIPDSFLAENVGSTELNQEAKKVKEGTIPKSKKMLGMKTKHGMKEDSSMVGPVFMIVPKAKEQRMKDEKGLKVLRWNFSTPSSKYVEQLKAQMGSCLSSTLQEELFHSNFQHHIKALAIMTKHLEEEKDGVISCLDLILKWLTLRLFDTNTWVLMKSLEYLKRLFDLLIQENYQLTENEASSFLPYLLLKMGATKESILKEVQAIVKQTILIYPVSKIFCFLLEGAKGKNPSQKMGCLEELGWLLKEYGPHVCQPNPRKALKTIISLTGDSNNAVHSAALRVIATARDVYGSEVFKAIAGISEKHMNLLEDSIREEELRRLKEEKVSTQVFNLSVRLGSVESSKRSYGISNHPEEEYLAPQQDRTQTKNDSSITVCQSPKWSDNVPSTVCHESQSGSNINMIICHVASGNISSSIKALSEIQEILRQEDKANAMSGHTNQFLIATLRQLTFIQRFRMAAEEETEKGNVIELYSSIIRCIISLFKVDSLAQETSAGVLKDLMNILITLLLDSPAEDLPEVQEVTQSISLLMTMVLERSDQTRILSSLLALLCESLLSSNNLPAFSEVVAKCTWKTARLLPQTIGSINLGQILLDVHIFMKAFPEEKLKQYQSHIPLRALNTLLHTLCKLKGSEILDHLTLIEDRDESELKAYLGKMIRHSAEQDTVDSKKEYSGPAEDKVNTTLVDIFKKINCKETARAGLEELYEHKKEYPETDLEPFLKNCSLLFRSYVKHGLAVMRLEREKANRVDDFL